MKTLRDIIKAYEARLEASQVDSPRLSAEVLLAHAMGVSRSGLLQRMVTAPKVLPDPQTMLTAESLIARREQGEPVAYLTGTKEFYGREFAVSRATLIPRPDTETLIDTALTFALRLPATHVPLRYIDMGTGSGAIAVTLALEMPNWQGLAVDLSPAALDVAKSNATTLGVSNLSFLVKDFCSPDLPSGPYALIAANPPYVSEAEYETLSHEVAMYEPKNALVPNAPNATGLECLTAIMDRSATLLCTGGLLLMEIGCSQGDALLKRAQASGGSWRDACIINDLAQLPRVFSAIKAG